MKIAERNIKTVDFIFENTYNSNMELFVNDIIIKLEELMILAEDNKKEIRYFKNQLAIMLFKKFGKDKLIVTNINEVYPSNYPITPNVTKNDFQQFEVVLDTSEKKHEIGIILNVYNDTELRLDTNGNMTIYSVKKINLAEFMKRLDFAKRNYYSDLVRGLLI